MPWKEQSTVGERWRLVQALLRREQSVRYWCRHFGVSRKTAYKWLQRFMSGGRKALRDRSRRPRRLPDQRWVEQLKRLRKRRPDWGPKKLWAQLRRQGWAVASVRTVARYLKRLKLVPASRRRPPTACVRAHPALTVARRPNQVWTVDFKGWFRTGNGQRCEPLTVRDLYSRYGLLVRLLPTQRWQGVQAEFIRLFRARAAGDYPRG
jgi:putative transposase